MLEPVGDTTMPHRRLRMAVPCRRIDFLKVDMDMTWQNLGMERLLTQRAFRVGITGRWFCITKWKACIAAVSRATRVSLGGSWDHF